ncbi:MULTISPECIES: 4Fe-4S dicluster domain-containing protein [Anoxybacillus]|uniref:4Fe-4S dicluster domain-containing protein n=1 Tax=Anoxybacillus TaxID=150247 RepID=UPI000ACE1797|nr:MULTISPECIES: 4Fe-4S dicluster domain-containing protein [Anoxybacillus]
MTKCDGCAAYDTPLCVTACRQKNEHRFPQPQKPIKDYWPRKKHEDWSNEKDRTDRLTPYNWTYVEKVQVSWNGQTKDVAIPRRCMHCLDAPCQKLCPFGVIEKTKHGAVKIDENFCMGGAKCRAVCSWDIPQRQAGVGLYMQLVPELAGGGVMYKCDMCADLLKEGKSPACEAACPKGAIEFGPYEQIRKKAYERAKEIGGFIYGDVENSGTLTLYVSDVPFDKIDEAIEAKKKEENDTRFGRPHMKSEVENMLETTHGYMLATLIAPIAGAAAAGITAYKVLSGQKKKEGGEHCEAKEEK